MARNEVINPGWTHYARYTFAPAVKRGNLLFISGITATDEEGRLVGEGDIVAQCRCIYRKMDEVLAAAGATFANIVMTTDYVTTLENYRATADVRRKVFQGSFPAATGVVVKELVRKDALIEIDAIAVLDG
ncbi:MAG: RidA family protein [Dehalococcoidia bacterium]